MAARGQCAEMLTQHYDLEPQAAQPSRSCENPPIPQLTRITRSSPSSAFRRKPVLYSTFHGHKPYLTEGLPRWLSGREPACQCRRLALIPGSGRSPGAEMGNPRHYSCLGNPINRESGGLQSMGLQRVRRDSVTEHTHTWQKEPPGLWGLTGEGR